jgi:hypothetical protein
MKLSVRTLLSVSIATTAICTMLCCKKKPFKSEIGLYSVKQYHCYKINPSMDSNMFADKQIRIAALDNPNFLSWDNKTFHLSVNIGDTVKTFIHDTSIAGVYRTLYKLQYFSVTDEVWVANDAKDSIWHSF